MLTKRLVFDVEADGLLDTVENIHCIVARDVDTKEVKILDPSSLNRESVILLFQDATEIIGHNIIAFDIPLIEMFYGLDLVQLLGKEAIVDTYLWSKVLYPDRPLPKGCPTSIRNPVTNKLDRIGPHGLEGWGWRVGERKVEIYDWRYYTPSILTRCETDVIINEKVYYSLLKEANL